MRDKKTTRSYKLETNSCILGIDPGYDRVGFAVVESERRVPKLIHSECFETDRGLTHELRLASIKTRVNEILNEYKPDKLAIETLLFSKNVKTALKVAEARGVILGEVGTKGLEVSEHNPNAIKLCITGYGKADKKQMITMVDKLYPPQHKIKHDDEYDAIAVAVTCAVVS